MALEKLPCQGQSTEHIVIMSFIPRILAMCIITPRLGKTWDLGSIPFAANNIREVDKLISIATITYINPGT
jgi:hypothetical protein